MPPAIATAMTADNAPVHDGRSNRSSNMGPSRQGFGGGKPSWNSNIWGDNNIGNGFPEDQRPSFQAKSGSGSLLSTSESDGWGGRSQLPWNTSSLSVGQQKGPVQSRPNDRNAPAIAEAVDPTSYFTLPRTSGIGTSAGSSSRKAFLTSGPEGISPSGDSLSGLSGFKSGETRRHGNASAFGGTSMGSGFPIKGPFPGALDTPRSGELGESMPMSSLPQGAPDARQQPLSRGPYAHMSHNSASFTPQRPVHSATPSFHSESQGFDGRYGNTAMDVNAGLNKLQLNDGGFSGQLHRPPYLPHTSYDPSFQRVKYPTAGDNRAVAGYGSEGTTDLHLAYQAGKNQVGECDPIAPEYTRLGSPFYPLENPSPIAPHYRNGSGGRLSDGQAVALERKLRGLEQEQDYTQYSANPLQGAQYPPAYDFAGYQAARLNALSGFYPMAQLGGLGATAMVSRAHRDHDPTQIVRSPLLEEFRANSKGNKRYELKDIYNHVVEFSGDQHGSRFIQQKLETANSDEKEQVFREIQPNCLQLMTDVFGNYVVQKLFEHGNQSQKKILANQMKGHVLALSTQMYGCRVVQKALEHILTDQQAALVKELENFVLRCVRDQNGNHVIQKAIERVPSQYVQFVINAFKGQVSRLAAHPYGCRVIQRMLEHCEEDDRESILTELHGHTMGLIPDQFGNYVIQHVIENGEEKDRSRMIDEVMSQLLSYSKHKFASNVVEKSIEFGEETQRRQIIQALTSSNERGESPLLGLMRDQYGNYVIQKVLGQLKAGERDALVEQIKPLLSQLKKFSYGKQIVAIEKLIFDPASVPNAPMHAASSTTPPNSHKSSPQPSKRPLNSADNCRVPAVGAAPPTPPPTDNPCNAESTADTKCGVRSTVTAVEAEDGTDVNARVEITQA